MAKLTKQEWANARARWERSSKDGFQWLASELNVSRQIVERRAKTENWTKKVANKSKKVAEKVAVALNVANNEEVGKFLKINGKYHESFPDIAYRLCLMGTTDSELATLFKVHPDTVDNWRDKYPEFDNRINEARMLADSLVAESLFKSALGMHGVIEEREVLDNEGNKVVLTTKKTVPPSFNAQSLWLRNKQSDKWKEKQETDVNVTLGNDLIETLKNDFALRMQEAHERNNRVLLERGITLEPE